MELLLRMNLKNEVERVLHVKGNYSGGILEMTLVIDCGLPKEYVSRMAADIAATLRSHSEVFRNVRLNLLYWRSDTQMENQVLPFSFLQMEKCFEGYCPQRQEKLLDVLSDRLKLFHARSKLILVLAGEKPLIQDKDTLKKNMYPFLGKKSLFLFQNTPELKWYRGEVITEGLSGGKS